MPSLSSTVLPPVILAVLAGSSLASDLTLDGQVSLAKPVGRHVQVSLQGQPGLPVILAVAAKVAPSKVLGLRPGPGLPQSPLVMFLDAPSTDATGLSSLTVSTPNDPVFVGTTWHVVGATFDPVEPYGVDIAVGAELTLTDGDMVYIPNGQFLMGDHLGTGANDETPVHLVKLSAFHMQVYEVTNQLWVEYLNSALAQGGIEVAGDVVSQAGGGQPYFHIGSQYSVDQVAWDGVAFSVLPDMHEHPVTLVTWYGAAAFANWRSSMEGRTPCYDPVAWTCDFKVDGYRLPTEAEWEYAARGGEHAPYYDYPWGDTIDGSQANTHDSGDPWEETLLGTTTVGYYDGAQLPAGSDMANGYGLYDMSGNVWEWCNDLYTSTYYNMSPVKNPTGPETSGWRVMRSGSYYFPYTTGNYRCADRHFRTAPNPSEVLGFRLVRRD